MRKLFERRKEDFVCEKCGFFTKGDGFTDHCPRCLFSKHVDINPGDRMSSCNGIMEPIGVEKKGENYFIYYRCLACNYKHRVKKAKEDSFEEVIKISKEVFKDGK
jgi:rubrerythrin